MKPSGNFAPILRTDYKHFIEVFLFMEAQIVMPLGCYKEALNFLERFGRVLFHRFGRCPNQGDFLEEFTCESAPKLVLATTGSSGPPWGGLFVTPLVA